MNPSGLTFLGPFSTPNTGQATKTLLVSSPQGVTGTVGYTAAATSAGNWLSVAPATGTLPVSLAATATVVGLNPGIYTGTITITPTGGRPTVVAVTLSLSQLIVTPTTFTLSQNSITIRHQIGTAAPSAQNISVLTSSGTPQQFTASTSTPWISLVRPFDGVPGASLTECGILVQPAGLTAGTYTGTVTVTVAGLPPQDLPVALVVTTTPALNAYPSLVLMDDVSRTAVPVTVASTGSVNLPFTAAVISPAAGIHVYPTAGSTTGGFQVLVVTADTAGLAAGTYLATITLTVQGSGATFNIPVRLSASGTAAAAASVLSTSSVALTAVAGEAPPWQTVNVATVPGPDGTTQAFTAAATSSGGWLSVAPFSGNAPALITLTASTTAVPPGSYKGAVTITSLATGTSSTIDVTYTLSAKVIRAEPASLEFAQAAKSVAPQAQTLQITGNAPSSFSVAGRPSWISVNPLTALTPAVLSVSADPTGLGPGTYKGSVRLSGPNQLDVPVSLVIPELPATTATPASMSFAHELGGPAPGPQSLSIGSTGASFKFTATAAVSPESGLSWLKVAPATGTTPASLAVSVDTTRIVQGQYVGAITIASLDGSAQPKTVAVTLTVRSPTIVARELLNAATLAPTAVSPGQIVTITGTGLGPAAGAVARPTGAGAIETQLAGVRVMFDGIPAPLLFVRDDQINAIAPYALYGRASTRLQIEFGGSFSVPLEFKVVDVAPGIFTAAGSGQGQAAALNADFTTNSIANPAPRGGVIMVFGTGEGQTDPPGQDGRIIQTDLRRPLLAVTARIGGRPAEILYAGSAPTLVSGSLQVNVRIPEDIDAGSVPIDIQVGGVASQSRVTIAVR